MTKNARVDKELSLGVVGLMVAVALRPLCRHPSGPAPRRHINLFSIHPTTHLLTHPFTASSFSSLWCCQAKLYSATSKSSVNAFSPFFSAKGYITLLVGCFQPSFYLSCSWAFYTNNFSFYHTLGHLHFPLLSVDVKFAWAWWGVLLVWTSRGHCALQLKLLGYEPPLVIPSN